MPDSDNNILFMSAPGIFYSDPVADPWFSAQKPRNRTRSDGTVVRFWEQDEPLGVMACTEQFQYCNPNLPESKSCEPLRRMFDTKGTEKRAKFFPSEALRAAMNWIDRIWWTDMNQLSDASYYIGASALHARLSLSNSHSGPLLDNQWQIAAEHLKEGGVASLQHAFVEAANGVPISLEEFRQPPLANKAMAQMICASQKIVSDSCSSFNVIGVSLILSCGMLIIFLYLGLAPILCMVPASQVRKAADSRCRE